MNRDEIMSRRPVNPSKRFPDSASIPFAGAFHHKTQSSPILSIGLVIVVYAGTMLCFPIVKIETRKNRKIETGALLLIVYSYSGSGGFGNNREAMKDEASSCTSEALKAIPFLQKVYGDSMRKVLHVGPDTCSVVSKLLKEEDTEAWGVEPYDLEDADSTCKSLVRKGIVRVADIKFALPYRPKSFSLVIVSDALDYLSPRYLNKTLPDLARVSIDGVVVFSGYPGQERTKVPDLSKFGKPAKLRSSSWWIRYFIQMGLEENETATKKFEQTARMRSRMPGCQVFHLNT